MLSPAGLQLAKYWGPDYTFGLGRNILMEGTVASSLAFNFFEAAALLGHQEAQWMLSIIKPDNAYLSTVDLKNTDILHGRLEELFAAEGSPRALAYAAWFTGSDGVIKLSRAEAAAKTGDGLGHYLMSVIHEQQNPLIPNPNKTLEVWHRQQAMTHNIGEAYEDAARFFMRSADPDIGCQLQLKLKAAHLGIRTAMGWLSYQGGLLDGGKAEQTKWKARAAMSNDSYASIELLQQIQGHEMHLDDRLSEIAVERLYVIGRELDGYQDFFPKLVLHDIDDGPVDIVLRKYRSLMGRVRTSSLFTVAVLKRLVGKDVARMIAKMVYATRDDPYSWYAYKSPITPVGPKPKGDMQYRFKIRIVLFSETAPLTAEQITFKTQLLGRLAPAARRVVDTLGHCYAFIDRPEAIVASADKSKQLRLNIEVNHQTERDPALYFEQEHYASTRFFSFAELKEVAAALKHEIGIEVGHYIPEPTIVLSTWRL